MIDIKQSKKYLIAALEINGFRERKDKSCVKYRIYDDGSNKLLVSRSKSGFYEYYSNANDDNDYGDTVQFLLKYKLGIDKRRESSALMGIDKREYQMLEKELNLISCSTVSTSIEFPSEVKQITFDIGKYDIRAIAPGSDMPSSPKYLLFKRRINLELSSLDFKDSIALLKSTEGYSSLLFYWRNSDMEITGAQFKYMKQDECVKRFLRGSSRESSLWMQNIDGGTTLFVAEDPLDALAHKQIYPEKNYAYVCSGGSITSAQIALIHNLAAKRNIPIVLGNDNDIAGQIANYKIVEPAAFVSYNKEQDIVKIIMGQQLQEVPGEEFTRYVKVMGAKKGIQVECPISPRKDWNDYILPQKKSELLKIISQNNVNSDPCLKGQNPNVDIKV